MFLKSFIFENTRRKVQVVYVHPIGAVDDGFIAAVLPTKCIVSDVGFCKRAIAIAALRHHGTPQTVHKLLVTEGGGNVFEGGS